MKLSVIVLTVVLSLISATSNAADGKISPVVLNSFNSSFASASEVKSSATAEYYKAEFSYNGMYISAFYDGTGNMIALTRNISSLQLPVTLQTSLKKDYSGMWISDLFEVNDENGTSFYVTVENADTKIILKSGLGSGWSTYQKECKS